MRDVTDYKFDLFLSWTGADRAIKNQINEHFKNLGLTVYDSDTYCCGRFRENYIEALQSSKVYLLLLTDNLRSNGQQHLTDVRNELSKALDLEGKNELNIVILCLSSFFMFKDVYRDTSDKLGWFFYAHTSGFSKIPGSFAMTEQPEAEAAEVAEGSEQPVEETANVPEAKGVAEEQHAENAVAENSEEIGGPLLDDATMAKIQRDVMEFKAARDNGVPKLSQAPRYNITADNFQNNPDFVGREGQLDEIYKCFFEDNANIVVLSGLGGIGKTKIAEEFAKIAKERGAFQSLQIVHAQDLANERDGLKLLVSETTFDNNVYSDTKAMSQSESYRYRLNLLKELPEYVLLVLDNFNAANTESLAQITRELKCHLLVTSRVSSDLNSDEYGIKQITVEKLPRAQALEMFRKQSRRDLSEEDFAPIYETVGGHTMTLCIMAKMLKEQQALSPQKLVSSLKNIGDMTEQTGFAHNETNQENTILGHLKELFRMSDPSEEGCAVLRNMCLLSDGNMSVADARGYFNLTTDNALNALKRYGWLETFGANNEFLHFHPLLSQLVFNIEKPNESNAGAIVRYLNDQYKNSVSGLQSKEAYLMENKLYYAIYRIAVSSGVLCESLWDCFTEVGELLGDVDDLRQKSAELSALVPGKHAVVTSYAHMIELEQFPTNTALLEKYIGELQANSADYKWVSRMLEVSLSHISRHPAYKSYLARVLPKAIAVAEGNKDDLAVLSLFAPYILSDKNAAAKNIKRYLKQRMREDGKKGELLLLKYLLLNEKFVPGGTENSVTFYDSFFDDIKNDDYEAFTKNVLRHPITYLSMTKTYADTKKLPDDDALKFYFDAINNATEAFVNYEEVDASELFKAITDYWSLLYENQLTTKATYSNYINSIITVIKRFPSYVQGELKQLVAIPLKSADEMTVDDLKNLQTASVINSAFAYYEQNNQQKLRAIAQSAMLVRAEKLWHSPSHYKVVNALISHANTCAIFGYAEEALKYNLEAYYILKEHTCNSQQLLDVCRSLLSNSRLSERSYGLIKEIKNTAKEICPSISDYCEILSVASHRYAEMLKSHKEGVLLKYLYDWFVKNCYIPFVNEVLDVCKHFKEYSDSGQTSLVFCLCTLEEAISAYNTDHLNDVINYLDALQQHGKRNASRYASVYSNNTKAHIATETTEKVAFYKQTVRAALKVGLWNGTVAVAVYEIIRSYKSLYAFYDCIGELFDRKDVYRERIDFLSHKIIHELSVIAGQPASFDVGYSFFKLRFTTITTLLLPTNFGITKKDFRKIAKGRNKEKKLYYAVLKNILTDKQLLETKYTRTTKS